MKNGARTFPRRPRQWAATLLLLSLVAETALAGATAYEALRAVKAARGGQFLGNLVEIRGTRGEPQPQSWTLLFNDPTARGGVREMVVQNGLLVSERTPVRGFSGVGDLPTIAHDRLNLDSDGAFQLANQAAVQKGVGFHWIDYTLRSSGGGKGAVWILELTDYLGAPVGAMHVSAENLRVVRELTIEPGSITRQATVGSGEVHSEPLPHGGVLGKIERFGKNSVESVRSTTLDVIGSVEEWLTGERTIGLEEE